MPNEIHDRLVMTKYGQAAIDAVRLFQDGTAEFPQEAWNKATAAIFGKGTPSQVKGCPRGAFLGLCEEGLIQGVPGGKYTRSNKNRKYAARAVQVLRSNPAIASDKKTLWAAVLGQETKKHNEQLDVVIALWRAGFISR